jgi:DNA-binding cell septation regulator SpoVG
MKDLEITDLVINPVNEPNSKVKAVCEVTFNSALTISGINIESGKYGLTVTCPKMSVIITDILVKNKFTSRILATYLINHCVEDNQQ